MHTKILLAKEFPSLTDRYSVLPMLLHGVLDDVPELTIVHVEHLSPKWVRNPSTESPRSITAIAVLGRGRVQDGARLRIRDTRLFILTQSHRNKQRITS